MVRVAADCNVFLYAAVFAAATSRYIINVLEFSVEGIFNQIVLFVRWGVSTNKTDVIKFCPYADCGYFFVHRCESRGKVAKSLTNHKSASEFVLINMSALIHIARC